MADAPKPPPNLRVSDSEAKECDSCKHYQRGRCSLYNSLPVDGEWVCDSWAKGSQTDDDADDAPTTLREASVKVREHFRRARQASSQQ